MKSAPSATAVEAGGIEAIPSDKRHGSPWQLLATWSAPNLEFATIFIGVLAVGAFGLSFWQAVLAVTLGNALGAISHGVLSTWGPREGLVQFVLARTAFGHRGNAVPAMLNTLMASLGWFAVNSASGAFALMALTNMNGWLAVLIVVAAEILLAFVGYGLVQAYERYAAIALTAIFAIATVMTFSSVDISVAPTAGPNGFPPFVVAFTLAFGAAYGYAAGWNPFASDFSRYLPKTTSRAQIGWAAGLGNFLSTTILMASGAALALLPTFDWVNPTVAYADNMGLFGKLVLLAIVVGAVAANAINLYSSAMSFLAAGIKLPFAWRRGIVVLVAGVFGSALAAAAVLVPDFYHNYEGFLLVVAYWVAPWLGVVLMDRYLRRGTAITVFVTDAAKYKNPAGLISWLAAMAISIWGFSNQQFYTGPVAKAFPIGDIALLVGIVLGAVFYAILFAVIKPKVGGPVETEPELVVGVDAADVVA
ncbi:MAG TPA: cytosine permease [Microbacteriaceae bacterium]|nr:cytosine permease [Microbacteriaceae bacterium]